MSKAIHRISSYELTDPNSIPNPNRGANTQIGHRLAQNAPKYAFRYPKMIPVPSCTLARNILIRNKTN